jgi:uncharacterized membrane protein
MIYLVLLDSKVQAAVMNSALNRVAETWNAYRIFVGKYIIKFTLGSWRQI